MAGLSLALVTGRRAPLAGDALIRARMRVLTRAAGLLAVVGPPLAYYGPDVLAGARQRLETTRATTPRDDARDRARVRASTPR